MKINGLPLIDATTSLTITVKPNDIKKATRNDATSCALAQSLKREYKVNAQVLNQFVYVEGDGHWLRYVISTEDRKMIRVFDNQKYFRAGTYILHPPPNCFKLGYKNGRSGTNTRPKKVEKIERERPTRTWATGTVTR